MIINKINFVYKNINILIKCQYLTTSSTFNRSDLFEDCFKSIILFVSKLPKAYQSLPRA